MFASGGTGSQAPGQRTRRRWLQTSGGARVLVNETAETLPTHDLARLGDRLRIGRSEPQGAVRAGPVVVVEVLAQDLDQVALAQDD